MALSADFRLAWASVAFGAMHAFVLDAISAGIALSASAILDVVHATESAVRLVVLCALFAQVAVGANVVWHATQARLAMAQLGNGALGAISALLANGHGFALLTVYAVSEILEGAVGAHLAVVAHFANVLYARAASVAVVHKRDCAVRATVARRTAHIEVEFATACSAVLAVLVGAVETEGALVAHLESVLQTATAVIAVDIPLVGTGLADVATLIAAIGGVAFATHTAVVMVFVLTIAAHAAAVADFANVLRAAVTLLAMICQRAAIPAHATLLTELTWLHKAIATFGAVDIFVVLATLAQIAVVAQEVVVLIVFLATIPAHAFSGPCLSRRERRPEEDGH